MLFYLPPKLYNLKGTVLLQIDPQKFVVSSLTVTLNTFPDKDDIYQLIKDENYTFMDVTACDNVDNDKRYALMHNFYNYHNRTRLLLRQYLKVFDNPVTASKIFPASNPAEREVYDLFGIFFNFHSDLRRILTDYSFKGHPLKKDYPLSGYTEIIYSTIKKTLVFKPIVFIQDFRPFDFLMPWNEEMYPTMNALPFFLWDDEMSPDISECQEIPPVGAI